MVIEICIIEEHVIMSLNSIYEQYRFHDQLRLE